MSGLRIDGMPMAPRARPITWTPTFIGFLAYMCIMTTARLPVATVAMVAALLGLVVQRETLRTPTFLWLLAAWLAWACIGYAMTDYPDRVADGLIQHGKLVLVTLVAVNALRTTTQVRYFMVFVLVSYLLFPARSTLQGYIAGYTLFGRAVGPRPYENPNDLAALTILMLGPALALWAGSARGTWVRWMGLAGAAPLIVIIVLSQSRGAFLALVAIALPSTIALARRRPRTVIALAALVGLALFLAPASFWERMGGLSKATNVATVSEMDPEGSARLRYAVLQTATRIIGDHPLLGVGLGAYELANARYSPALGDMDTHNTYVNVLAETGLPGLLLFLTLVVSVLRNARDARRGVPPVQLEPLQWLQYCLIGYLIAGVFGSYSRLSFLYIFLALVWSASQALRAQWAPATQARPPVGPPAHPPMPVDRSRLWGA